LPFAQCLSGREVDDQELTGLVQTQGESAKVGLNGGECIGDMQPLFLGQATYEAAVFSLPVDFGGVGRPFGERSLATRPCSVEAIVGSVDGSYCSLAWGW
jgi:hypothetical protein